MVGAVIGSSNPVKSSIRFGYGNIVEAWPAGKVKDALYNSSPADFEGIADTRLKDQGVREGDSLLVGPAEVPVVIVGFVDDTNYLLQGGLWVNLTTWREVQNANRPASAVGPGVFQALVVQTSGSTTKVADAIDAADAADDVQVDEPGQFGVRQVVRTT